MRQADLTTVYLNAASDLMPAFYIVRYLKDQCPILKHASGKPVSNRGAFLLTRVLPAAQTSHDGLRMLRTTHKHLFRNQTIFDAHDVRGWRGYTKGESESSFEGGRQNARLRK